MNFKKKRVSREHLLLVAMLEHLPQEVLVIHVLSRLQVQDLLSCSLVSWSFNQACSDEFLWKRLTLTNIADQSLFASVTSSLPLTAGYKSMYQHYIGLLKDLYIALRLRTEECDIPMINNPSRITHSLKFTNANVNMMRIDLPLEVSVDYDNRGRTYLMYE
jgi:hypothetical protein